MTQYTTKELKSWLEKAPIYHSVTYSKQSQPQSNFEIREIDSYCDNCKTERPFHDFRTKSGLMDRPAGTAINFPLEHLIRYEFICVSCNAEKRTFFVNRIINDYTVSFEKVGEMPRQKLDRDKQLEKFFKRDSENYNKAIVCLSHGYGIAAFAYMRRIIENNIDGLLELISEDVTSTGGSEVLIKALSDLKSESPMSEKIKIANNALPIYLQPDGLNPLGRLYKILSEGVHTLPDHECLEKAQSLKACIKYLICEITTRKKNRQDFKGLINEM